MLSRIGFGQVVIPFTMFACLEGRHALACGLWAAFFCATLFASQPITGEARADEAESPRPTELTVHETPLAPYLGDVLLVNFWTSWCPPCIREMPELEALARDVAGRPFRVVMVNVEEPPGIMRRFKRLTEAGIASLRDPNAKFARGWGVTVYPTSFVVDREGRVVERFVGPADWTGAEWTARFERLLPACRGDAAPSSAD